MSEPAQKGEPAERADAADESDRLHAQVGWTLRIGLGLSVIFFAGGLLVRLATGVEDAPAARPLHFGGDLGLVLSTLGVTTLALTPALRVLALVVLWWRERDWRFVVVALAVVATLAGGVMLGKGG